jgi:hypothetical protein
LKSCQKWHTPRICYYLRMPFKHWISAAVAIALGAFASVGYGETSTPPEHAQGIWKAVVPPKTMKGEFDNMDPLGVAAGARIPADCSLNWIDPDDGKLYCFVSGTSLEFFLDGPKTHLQQARAGWLKLTGSSS